jgi:hypothetical protein
MKALSLLTIASVLFSAGMAQAGHFNCDNAPQTKWGTYFCISGNFTSPQELVEVEFGTCEGSVRDEEAEPVEIVTFGAIRHDPSRAASSSQWKQASAFNVSTKEFGENTMYVQTQSFAGGSDQIIRLKGSAGDIKLKCTFR